MHTRMSFQIKRSVGKVKCAISGHEISIEDEDQLYIKRARKIQTKCSSCGKPVMAEVNETNEDEFFVTDI